MSMAIIGTKQIFRGLVESSASYVPAEVHEELTHALANLEAKQGHILEELEDTIIAFGKKVWPYRKAFDELVDVYEQEVGEQFFLQKLSAQAKKQYTSFRMRGGSLQDLHVGSPAQFFSIDERMELCSALIGLRKDMETYALQRTQTTDKKRFEKKVAHYASVLHDIEGNLDALKNMAKKETSEALASEILAQVRAFEQGLCLLGPNTRHDAVCESVPHFEGRQKDFAIRV